jgi:hypothetical protein
MEADYAGGGGWPTLIELYRLINTLSIYNRYIIICDDHVYIVPDNDKYKELLLEYTLERSMLLWKQDYRMRNKVKLLKRSIKNKFDMLLKMVGLYESTRRIHRKIKAKIKERTRKRSR